MVIADAVNLPALGDIPEVPPTASRNIASAMAVGPNNPDSVGVNGDDIAIELLVDGINLGVEIGIVSIT